MKGEATGEGVVLAIDCGTQSLRALAFDAAGRLLAKRKVEYEPYIRGEPGRAEQDPEVYWRALVTACRGLLDGEPALRDSIRGVAVTAQRDSMVCLDRNGDPVRNAILWLDQRRARPVYRPGAAMRLAYAAVGMGEAVMKTQEAGKGSWIAQNDPAAWERTAFYVQVSGFLNARLSGEMADSTASQIGHMPFDYRRQEWAAPGHLNARLFPVPPGKLSRLAQAGSELGRLTRTAAWATGLPEDLPVFAAGSDKGCETIGMGVLDESLASLSFGTTATVQTTTARYAEPLAYMPAYPAPVPGRFNPEVEIFRGYWMITWFKTQFAYEEVLEASRRGIAPEAMLDELLARTPPGARGLVMQPYWTPMLKMPSAKGAIIGFGDAHDRAHIYRAIIEGLAYGLKDGLASIERATGKRTGSLAVSGGASQSDEICRISADVFGLPISRGETYETSGLGAAMCAAAGLGWYASVEDASRAMSRRARTFEPDLAATRLYGELFERVYKRMYRALAPLYEEIRDITNYPERPE